MSWSRHIAGCFQIHSDRELHDFAVPASCNICAGQLQEWLDELKVISAWDQDYLSRSDHDELDTAAWTARGMRLTEIYCQLAIALIGSQPADLCGNNRND